MKTFTLLISLLFLFLVARPQINSTTSGGLWTEPSTWSGGIVPGPTSSVIINGPVYVNGSITCNNMTIQAAGSIRNYSDSNYDLTVNGNLTNSGTIANNNYSLYLYVRKNMTNNGTWQNHQTVLISNQAQLLSFNQPFNGAYLYNSKTGNTVTAVTSLTFQYTYIDFAGYQLTFSTGTALNLTGGYLHNMVISKTTSPSDNLTLNMSAGAYIYNSTINSNNLTLAGTVLINYGNTFNAQVTNQGTLANYSDNNYSLTINNHIINNGIITNNNYNLDVYVSGNITNNSTWNNYQVFMNGPDDQGISTSSPLRCFYLHNQKPSGSIQALTDLNFENCRLHINSGSMNFYSGKKLIVDGGYIYLAYINLTNPNADTLEISLMNNCFFNSSNIISGGVIMLSGTTLIHGSATFNGTTINTGTLTNYSDNNYTAYFNGSLVNHGDIINNNYGFYIELTENLENNGNWSNIETRFTGSGDQGIITLQPFSGTNLINNKPSGKLLALSDLSFINCLFQVNYAILEFTAGNHLSLSGGYILFSDIQFTPSGSNTLYINMTGGAYFYSTNTVTAPNIDISGDIIIYGQVYFYGEVINNSNLYNYPDNNYSAYVYGNIVNNGSIINNNYNLYMYISGNLTNSGTWQNYYTALTGYSDQALVFNEPYSGYWIENTKPSGNLTANSTLTFNDSRFHVNGNLIFENGHKLVMTGGYCYNSNMSLVSKYDSLEINLVSGAFLNSYNNITANNIKLSGIIPCHGTVSMNGTVINTGTLYNYPDNNYALTVVGNIRNKGTITNNNYSFPINLTGDIINEGIWQNYSLDMNGDIDQHITMTNPLNMQYLYVGKPSGNVVALSDQTFTNTNLHFYNNNYNFIDNFDLNINGGFIYQANITQDTPGADTLKINMQNGAFFHTNNSVQTDVLLFVGEILVHGTTTINARLLNQGSLKNYPDNDYSLYINGDLINNGFISNNNYLLYIYLTGNLENNGEWSNYQTYLTGTNLQSLKITATFTGSYLTDNDPASPLEGLSELLFNGTELNLNSSTLTLAPYTGLSVLSGRLIHAIIMGNHSYLEMNGNDIYNSSIHDMDLRGTINVGLWTYFYGEITNEGILQNHGDAPYELLITGNLTNNGTITNNYYELYVRVTGDIANNGIWQNSWTLMDGNVDQTITLVDNKAIAGQIRLRSNIGAWGFLWYRDMAPLHLDPDFAGATGDILHFLVPVTSAYTGTYFCLTDMGPSRNIFINTFISPKSFDLTALLEGPFNGNVMSTNLNSSGFIPHNHPYSASPWNYMGTEWVANPPNTDVVDWVLVEIRQAPTAGSATQATMVGRKAGFLLKTGKIVSIDGTSPLEYNFIVNDNLYAIIWHRNHLAIMSANPLAISGGIYNYDFSTGSGQVYGGVSGHKLIGSGKWGMVSGDGDASGTVANADKLNIWVPQAGQSGYKSGDFNLSGQVDNNDKNLYWKPNSGRGEQVP